MTADPSDVISVQPRKVPGWLAWIMVIVVVAATAATAVTAIGHSHPAGRLTACGPGQVPGYSNQRSYPPGLPTLPPPGTHLIRCFASSAVAAGQDFPVAAPAGTLIVGGVFLEPTGSLTMRQCRAVAHRVGYAVPCPMVAPAMTATPPQLPNCNDNGGCFMGQAGFIFTEQSFAAPPRYDRTDGQPGYFQLLASRKAGRTNPCPPDSLIRRVQIGVDHAAIYGCPFNYGGEAVLTWTHETVHVAVSFLGVNATNIDLDLAIARHLSWVSPAN